MTKKNCGKGTSQRVAHIASELLRKSTSSKVKSVAASDLSQTNKNHKNKKK